ncbi:unnamed protein product [Pylaiella littoralis]
MIAVPKRSNGARLYLLKSATTAAWPNTSRKAALRLLQKIGDGSTSVTTVAAPLGLLEAQQDNILAKSQSENRHIGSTNNDETHSTHTGRHRNGSYCSSP